MFVIGEVRPTEEEWIQEDVKVVDMTPWRFSGIAGVLLIACVIGIYAYFADFGGGQEVTDQSAEVVATQPSEELSGEVVADDAGSADSNSDSVEQPADVEEAANQ